MNVLIVDDEPLAREGLRTLLEREDDISIVGECGNGAEAIRAILTRAPDLVFLDIRMPRVSGLDVVETVGTENMPPVVFLTAYDEHAVAAFELQALDYLLKPLEPERLASCLARARATIRKDQVADQAQRLKQLLGGETASQDPRDRIVVRSAGHVHFLRPVQIAWIEAGGDYVTLHAEGCKHLLRDTMQNMERRLLPLGFRRIHRSAIVNLDFVAELVATDSGDYVVVLSDDTRLKLSRSYRDELYAALNA